MSSLFGIGGGGNVGAAGGSFYDYEIENSVRMSDASNSQIYWSAGTPSSGNIWTASFWFKKWSVGAGQAANEMFSAGSSGAAYMFWSWDSSDKFTFQSTADGNKGNTTGSPVFRDVSAWSHMVIRADTTQSTQADRLRVYHNGEQITTWGTDSIGTSAWDYINASGFNQYWGGASGIANGNPGCNFYLADINFCDGQSYAPTEFAETKNGIWVAKDTSGLTFGNNGYRLEFKQTGTGADANGIGADTSGKDNHFTVSGLSASNIVPDSPTLNYPTWNPLVYTGQTLTFAEGNLNLDASSTSWSTGTWNQSTMGVLGGSDAKYYFEFTMNGNTSGSYVIGIGRQNSSAIDTTHYTGGVVYYYNRCSSDATNTVTGLTIASSLTIIRLAFDASNGKVWIGDDNGYFNSGDPAAGTGEVGTISGYDGEMLVAILNRSTNTGDQVVNFGQDDTFAGFKTSGSASAADGNGYGTFYYTPPTGFLALNSASLPEPTIAQPSDYFNTVLYTGDGTASNAITSVFFQPDFLWIKQRSPVVRGHQLMNSVRGASVRLQSHGGAGETASALVSFDSDGFTVDGTTLNGTNADGDTFVAWNWKAGGSSNTFNIDGTGYATASAAGLTGGNIAADAASISKTAGISILKYTGDGSSSPYSTIKHGLDSPPEFYICKSLDADNADNWVFFHTLVDGSHDFMYLNLTNANSNSAINFPPTDTTVKVGGNSTNENNKNFLMIAGHSVEGFSKCGSYVGNGQNSPDGTFVLTGFRPAFVMVKNITDTGSWVIIDNKRAKPYNIDTARLYADDSAEETALNTNRYMELFSNGFRLHGNDATSETNKWNESGDSYIYIAIAEQPLKFATAR